ncbi:MAG: NupC/NupG family nucleoside CNT transporter [Thermoguttaceae bacterium]|jgi:CNT family concentrative nucleoside transporter|nr:NupC/NupG family nucleoside CNT transporter [Thermoguttaceae bacterium]
MERLVSLLGLGVVLLLAWAMSENRRRMNWRLIASGIGLQVLLAMALLWTSPGQAVFQAARDFITRLVEFSDAGAEFVLGSGDPAMPETFKHHYMAFKVLPTIIFVSTVMAVLFHLGVMQWVVKGMAWIMVRVMDTSGTESLAAAAEVFVGMTESPLVIRPYLETMTRSEIVAMMTAGMGTVAGGVMAAYVGMGIDAGHLLAASLMAAPASLVIAKIMVPETEESLSKGVVRIDVPRTDVNVLDAACRGASEGLKLALNVAAMLIAFVALVHALNWALGLLPALGGAPVSLERILGWCMAPLAWVLGVAWNDAQTVGMLLGKKIVLNEFLAYGDLQALRASLSPRSVVIATYALCGFANFGSVAVQIGGIGGLVPSRRSVFARYGLRAMIGGALATLMTACIAGMLIGEPNG